MYIHEDKCWSSFTSLRTHSCRHALSQAEDSSMRFFSISQQISKDKKQYYDILERTQKGSCDITDWILWYLECLLRSIEHSDELLSKVINKAIFWQHHAGIILSERQKEILNLYLDGYPGKLTTKNWAMPRFLLTRQPEI